MMPVKHHIYDATVSYGIGGGAILSSTGFDLHTVATTSQDLALIVGFLVVFIRLIYDTIRFVSYVQKKRSKHDEEG